MARMRARLRDVVRPQSPVEGDGGVQALKIGVLGLRGNGTSPRQSMAATPPPVSTAEERDLPADFGSKPSGTRVQRNGSYAPFEQRIVHATDIMTSRLQKEYHPNDGVRARRLKSP